jgi:hypothetical protein
VADLLDAGFSWLERQRRRFLCQDVLYRRGDVVLTAPATVGKTTFEVVSTNGILERIESRDFLIAAADLAVLGLPQRGDRVVEVRDTQTHTYEVLAPGRESHWRWSDPGHRCLRIHTKHLTTTETTP